MISKVGHREDAQKSNKEMDIYYLLKPQEILTCKITCDGGIHGCILKCAKWIDRIKAWILIERMDEAALA